MPETLANKVPNWARSYAPNTLKLNESFSVRAKASTLTESSQSIAVKESFTVKFSNTKLETASSKTEFEAPNPQGIVFKYRHTTTVVDRPVGFFGVKIEAKGYKKDEVQYMREFPTDSFPLGVISLDKNGYSIHSQKLQYGKQIVVTPQILQLLSFARGLGQAGVSEELAGFSLNTINGRLYYSEIMADVSFLMVYESCVIDFDKIKQKNTH